MGLIGATVLARTTESLLLGVTGTDSLVYLLTGFLVMLAATTAAVAGLSKIRRLSPMEALRAE
jgi:hypothetical protein